MAALYREHFVWRKIGEHEAVRYACLEAIETGRFRVQSADFFRLPIDRDIARQHEDQFVQLFIEADPAERGTWHRTLAEAIAQHDADFGD